jgi:prephenate dehydrogenase
VRIAFLGLGLIGGSITLALRRAALEPGGDGELRITAWSPTGRGPSEAVSSGIVDRSAQDLDDAIVDAELVVLAAPPQECVALIDRLGERRSALPADATVTDVVSTKVAIGLRADSARLRFVGGHPMAGRETTGFGAASPDLFAERPWVLVPGAFARAEDVARVEWLVGSCGARAVRLEAAEHDAAAAAVSHVPLDVSAALAKAIAGRDASALGVDWAVARALAATGWRDTTRLARGDPDMGAGIATTNRAAISRALELVRGEIDEWLADLESADVHDLDRRIAERLREARSRLDS